MNKKGFIFGIPMIITLVLVVIALGLLVWFGTTISDGLISLVNFLQKYGIWIFILSVLVVFYQQIRALMNYILRYIGVKV